MNTPINIPMNTPIRSHVGMTVEVANQLVTDHCVGKTITGVEIGIRAVRLTLSDGSALEFAPFEDCGRQYHGATLERPKQMIVDFGDPD